MTIATYKYAKINFSDSLFIDGYLTPDCQFKTGLKSIGSLFNLPDSELIDLMHDKRLRELGFTGKISNCEVEGEIAVIPTIDLSDFQLLILFLAELENFIAIEIKHLLVKQSLLSLL